MRQCNQPAGLLRALQVPNGAAGFYLLGRIYQLSNRHSAAIAYYSTAVQLDPMMWSAYEELCSLGARAGRGRHGGRGRPGGGNLSWQAHWNAGLWALSGL